MKEYRLAKWTILSGITTKDAMEDALADLREIFFPDAEDPKKAEAERMEKEMSEIVSKSYSMSMGPGIPKLIVKDKNGT